MTLRNRPIANTWEPTRHGAFTERAYARAAFGRPLALAAERRYVAGTRVAVGYDVHITRAESWLDAEEQPITLDAWLDYVRSDPEMRVDGRAEAHADQGFLAYENAGLAVWTAYSGDGTDGNHAWFDLQRGCVVVKNPDAEILRKMFRIALHFQARVQGDDGEDFGPDGDPVHE